MDNALPYANRLPAPGKRMAAVFAVLVHCLLCAFLFYGVRWQTDRPEAVEVELVRSAPRGVTPPEPVAEPTPPTPPQPVVEPKPQPVQKALPPPPKPDIAIKDKPEKKTEKILDPIQEQLKRETEQMKSQKPTQSMAEAAAKELAQMKSAQTASARSKAVADYLSSIRGKIRGHIAVPPGIQGNPEAIFDVRQLPTGEVEANSVRLLKSSGFPALDAAIERAILKSSPLPLPKPGSGDVFSRNLELRFRPLED